MTQKFNSASLPYLYPNYYCSNHPVGYDLTMPAAPESGLGYTQNDYMVAALA